LAKQTRLKLATKKTAKKLGVINEEEFKTRVKQILDL
jgi:hypothetical protein